jgi:hypothetical protein
MNGNYKRWHCCDDGAQAAFWLICRKDQTFRNRGSLRCHKTRLLVHSVLRGIFISQVCYWGHVLQKTTTFYYILACYDVGRRRHTHDHSSSRSVSLRAGRFKRKEAVAKRRRKQTEFVLSFNKAALIGLIYLIWKRVPNWFCAWSYFIIRLPTPSFRVNYNHILI